MHEKKRKILMELGFAHFTKQMKDGKKLKRYETEKETHEALKRAVEKQRRKS